MGANYEQGMIQEVYYEIGRFKNNRGKKKYARAPFVLIRFQPINDAVFEDYFMPAPFGGSINSTDGPMSNYLGASGGDGEGRYRVGMGHLTRQDIIMNESELGNWSNIASQDEKFDHWTMFQRIGPI